MKLYFWTKKTKVAYEVAYFCMPNHIKRMNTDNLKLRGTVSKTAHAGSNPASPAKI